MCVLIESFTPLHYQKNLYSFHVQNIVFKKIFHSYLNDKYYYDEEERLEFLI
jgi:hypothetical protein